MRVVADTQRAFGFSSGFWTVWSLSDGHLDLPASSLIEPPADRHLPTAAPAGDQLRLSVNCFLLQRTGRETILIDCGAGGGWDDSMGHLARAFDDAGVSPEEVRILLLTHAHTDHINGLVARNGEEAFTSLDRILIPADAVARFNADASLARFGPRLNPIDLRAEIVADLRAVPLPGHAAGHTGYRLETDENTILFCGDIVHVPGRQFPCPELTWAYDEDQGTARDTRLRVLADAAAERTWLAGAHLGRPGVGKVVREREAYRFDALRSVGSLPGAQDSAGS